MKKITSLIVSGMLMLSMVGCGNTNQLENTTVQEQQVENPDMDKAMDLARQSIGKKYNATIGCGFIRKDNNTIEWMFVCDRFTLGTTLDDAGVIRDYEHLKEEVVKDYNEILKVFKENNVDIKLTVNMMTYPKEVTYFSIDEEGNIYDILDKNFIEDENNWVI